MDASAEIQSCREGSHIWIYDACVRSVHVSSFSGGKCMEYEEPGSTSDGERRDHCGEQGRKMELHKE